MQENKNSQVLHVAFYPWFALSHLTSFLRLANKLAERGHKVSYILPTKTQLKLASQNHHPDHLTFIPITVPPVDGLPPGAETTNDVPFSASPLIMTAMDMTRPALEAQLTLLKPDFIFYDFAYWMPELARKHGFKAVHCIPGRPFLAALRPPKCHTTIDSALPEGFTNRTKGLGIVYGGWVQQQQILRHPSLGCFVTHCGIGSLSEAMLSTCQVVLMPQAVDQFFNARQMSLEMKVGVEVELRDEDGFYTKEAICKAIGLVMEEGSEVGSEVRENHDKWRGVISMDGLEDSYISGFIESLQQLLG